VPINCVEHHVFAYRHYVNWMNDKMQPSQLSLAQNIIPLFYKCLTFSLRLLWKHFLMQKQGIWTILNHFNGHFIQVLILIWSWGPLVCHSSTTITSCCSMIMQGPMLQGSVHNSWKLKTSQFFHGQHTQWTFHPLSIFGVLWINV